MFLQIKIDTQQEFNSYFDENHQANAPIILMEKLIDVCQKYQWKFEQQEQVITIFYPIDENTGNVLKTIEFTTILEKDGIVLKQAIFPEIIKTRGIL